MRSHSETSFSGFSHTSSKLQIPKISFGIDQYRKKGRRAVIYSNCSSSTSYLNDTASQDRRPTHIGSNLPQTLPKPGNKNSLLNHPEEYILDYASPPYTPPDFFNDVSSTSPFNQPDYARINKGIKVAMEEVDEVVRVSKPGSKFMCPRYKCETRLANENDLIHHILLHNRSQDITLSTCRICQGPYYRPSPEHLCDENLKQRRAGKSVWHSPAAQLKGLLEKRHARF